jgi:hypothetical protein
MGRLEMKRGILCVLAFTAMLISCSEDSVIGPPPPPPPDEFVMMFETRLVYLVGEEPYCISAGDFDFDGDSDLAAVNGIGESVAILLNDSGG